MTEEIITLSHTEIDRVSVIQSIINRQLNQAQAAQQPTLSIRQVKRNPRLPDLWCYRDCFQAARAMLW